MRKTWIAITLALAFLLSFLPVNAAALDLGGFKDFFKTEFQAATEKPETKADRSPVLADNEDFYAEIMEYSEDEYFYTIKIYLENRSGEKLRFELDQISVNGYMCDPYWAKTVNPGKKCNEEIIWLQTNMEGIKGDGVRCIEFIFLAELADDYMADPVFQEAFTLYPMGDEADSLDFPKRELSEGDTIFYENESCRMILTGFEAEDEMGDKACSLLLYVENNSDENLVFSLDEVSVNDYMCDPYWSISVAPGKKALSKIFWWEEDFAENGIEEALRVEGLLSVRKADDWSADPYVQERLTVYEAAKDVQIPERTAIEGETILYENEDFCLIVKGFAEEVDYNAYGVLVYLENRTDRDLHIGIEDVSVNGFECEPYWSVEIAAGKRINDVIGWSDSSFEKNGITEVTEIEFKLLVQDAEDWFADPLFEDSFVLNP